MLECVQAYKEMLFTLHVVALHFHKTVVLSPDPTLSPHLLTGLVNLLELAYTLQQCNLATIKTICGKPAQKRYRYLNGDEPILGKYYVIIPNLAIF